MSCLTSKPCSRPTFIMSFAAFGMIRITSSARWRSFVSSPARSVCFSMSYSVVKYHRPHVFNLHMRETTTILTYNYMYEITTQINGQQSSKIINGISYLKHKLIFHYPLHRFNQHVWKKKTMTKLLPHFLNDTFIT